MKKYLRRKLINLLVKHLYKWQTEEDILIQNKDGVFLFGKKLSREQIDDIRQQADMMKNLELYQILQQELTKTANKNIFFSSTDIDDCYFGKVQLYLLDVIDKKLSRLSNL